MQKKEFNVLGLAGLLTGIMSVLLICFLIGGFFGIIGLIVSIIGLSKANADKGTSIAGLVLNIIAICFSLLWFIMLVFTEESTDITTQSTETIKELSSQIVESTNEVIIEEETIDCTIEKCNIKYLSHEIILDKTDHECVVVFFEFENDSIENKKFSWVAEVVAFQNGIELESSIWKLENHEHNNYLEIKPGASLDVYEVFILRDNSPVEIEIQPYSIWTDTVYDSMFIEVE